MNAGEPGAGDDRKEQLQEARMRLRKGGGEVRLYASVKLLVIFALPLMFMFLVVPTGFLVEGPGSSFDLQQDLEVSGAEQHPSQGELMLTSVRLEESLLIYHLFSVFNDEFELIKTQDFLGEDLDVGERELRDNIITQISEDTAAVVALRKLGIPVELDNQGALVYGVFNDYPADGVLEPGDVIMEINGERVENTERAGEILSSTPPGETLTLWIKELNEDFFVEEDDGLTEDGGTASQELWSGEREVQVQTVWDAELEKQVIGVAMRDFFTYTSEVEVSWELSTAVKGPSAGLMMALSIMNALTPEDITKGKIIAGTGEINLDESVGPIGGLPMKIQSAEEMEAEVFLYPLDNQADLAGVSTSLELYPVDNLDDALEALSQL